MTKLILAIETSCDETGLAFVEASGGLRAPKFKVLKNIVASQIKIHRPFGGVVPNLAKREHIKNLPILLKKLLNSKSYILNSIDIITVTVGPGLEPALWTGINFAQELAKKYKKPLIGANHLEGHLYSFLLSKSYSNVLKNIGVGNLFPAIALIVSGGHTILLLMKDLKKWKKLGETRDDAAGEAFDKVARLLDLPYPGGPEIEKIAKKGNPAAINFPRPMMHQKNYDFSFSGLKTAVFYYLRDLGYSQLGTANSNAIKKPLNPVGQTQLADVAASFQKAAIDVLVYKTIKAAKEYKAKSVLLSGGVAANKLLQKTLKSEVDKLNAEMDSHGRFSITEARRRRRAIRMQFFVPDFKYNTDNAVMIAIAGYMAYLRNKKYKLSAQGNLNI